MADLLDDLLDEMERDDVDRTLLTDDPLDELMLEMEREDAGIDESTFAAQYLGQKELKLGGIPAFERADIAALGDNFAERQTRFRQLHPTGDLRQIPTTDIIAFRTDPTEPFRKFDPGLVESFREGGIGRAAGELGVDVAEVLAESGPEIIGETAMAMARRAPAGAIATATRFMVGAGIGEAGQQAAQTAVGTQRETIGEQAQRSAGAAIASAIGLTVGQGIVLGVRARKGFGLGRPTERARQAHLASQEITGTGLMPGEITGQPLITRIERQAKAVSGHVQRYVDRRSSRASAAVEALTDATKRKQLRRELESGFDTMHTRIINRVNEAIGSTGRRLDDAVQDLRIGIDKWWRISRGDVDDAYTIARGIEEPVFDIPSLRNEVARIVGEADAAGRGVDQAVRREGLKILGFDDILEPRPALFPPGQASQTEIARAARTAGLSPARQPPREPITDPQGNVIFESATDQLRAIEQNLSDFALPGPEGMRIGQDVALKIRGAIRNTLDGVRNENPEFVEAWRHARKTALLRFDTREHAAVVAMMRDPVRRSLGDAAKRGAQLAQPHQASNIRALRAASTAEEFESFMDAVRHEVLRRPGEITKKLDALDQDTLIEIFGVPGLEATRRAGAAIDDLTRSGVQQALREQKALYPEAFVDQLLNTDATSGITALFNQVRIQGGINSPAGQAMRASLIDNIWRRSTVNHPRLGKVIDANQLRDVLDFVDEKGFRRFLTDREWKLLNDVELIQQFDRVRADVGASLAGAEAAAGFRGVIHGLLTGDFQMGVLANLLEMVGTGRLFTKKVVQDWVAGGGLDKPIDGNFIRMLGAAAAQVVIDNETQLDAGPDFFQKFDQIVNFGKERIPRFGVIGGLTRALPETTARTTPIPREGEPLDEPLGAGTLGIAKVGNTLIRLVPGSR